MNRYRLTIAVAVVLAACTPAGATPAAATYELSGHVLAGPVCPVVRQPPDPSCADRPVSGASLVIRDSSGAEVQRVTSNAAGRFTLRLAAGLYSLVPQPVSGLMGTAPPVALTVQPGALVEPVVTYDTGIR